MKDIRERQSDVDRPVAVDQLVEALSRAIAAPSLHNSQPWHFVVRPGLVDVRIDPRRRCQVSDPGDRAARMACGAAVYNLRLALAVEIGRPAEPLARPEGTDPYAIGRLRAGAPRPATGRQRVLYQAILNRHTNRYPFRDDTSPDAAQRSALVAAARSEQCWLRIITEPRQRADVAEMITEADAVLLSDPAYRNELASWVRDEPDGVDGIPRIAAGIRPGPYDAVRQRDYHARPRRPGHDFEPEPVLAVLGGSGDRESDHVAVGQALQAVLLSATSMGLAAGLYSQPMTMAETRAALRRVTGTLGVPYLVLRLGYPTRFAHTPRRPVSEVTEIVDEGSS